MTTIKPLVSIIIPTYDRAGTIERSIKSVLKQTYENFELIVVDDASDDDTELVVKEIKDERIRYLRQEANKGGGATRNTGIKAAKGNYIAFQDSDDEWLPEKLDKQMKVFESCDSDFGVVYTCCTKFNGNTVERFPDTNIINAGSSGFIHEKFLNYNLVTTQTALVKKECFEKSGGFDERLPRLQDWELWIRISRYYKFALINESLVNVYYTNNSITFNDFAFIEAMSIMLNKHKSDFIRNKAMITQIGILARYVASKDDIIKNLDYIMKNILCKINSRYSFIFILTLGQKIIKQRATLTSYESTISEYKVTQDKYMSNYCVLGKWFSKKCEGMTMEFFLKRSGYSSIAIYGAGDLGLKLYKEINSLGFDVTCFIDNYAQKVEGIDNNKVLKINDLLGYEADVVIITPTYDFERIRNELSKRGIKTIVSLEEVINSMC